MRINEVRADKSAEQAALHLQKVIETGSDRFECQHCCKDGRIVDLEVSLNLINLGGEDQFTSFFRDITERKKLTEERLKVTKLESIGLLAGGIAHEFNNVLTSVIGNLSLAQAELASTDPALEWLDNAWTAATRATELTRQLLTFAEGGDPIKEPIAVAEFLQQTVSAVAQASNLQAGLSIPPDLWQIEADAHQISQVIKNLILNAKEAMPDAGAIRVEACNVTLEPEEILSLRPGHYIKVSIKDEGRGISEHVLPKIFDPYFTTKPT